MSADNSGDLTELHLQFSVDRIPRPFTPPMEPRVLLALVVGMLAALDIDRFPSPAVFHRFRSSLEPPADSGRASGSS